MKDSPMTDDRRNQLYEWGRRAKRDGCFRILCDASEEEREAWFAGYDFEAEQEKVGHEHRHDFR